MTVSAGKAPRLFAPGTRIGMHLQVERVIRQSATRCCYLVNNEKRRWYTVKCWRCGNQHSPPSARNCSYCSGPLGFRRLLMTARWDPNGILQFQALANRRIPARTIQPPLALYRYGSQLLSVFDWEGENLLLHEPAPLEPRSVVQMAFQLADALQRLHDYGVVLDHLGPEHVLVRPSGSGRLFDLDVAALRRESIEPTDDPTVPPQRDIRLLAATLDDYCPLEAQELRGLFTAIRRGAAVTGDEMASMVATWARRNGHLAARSRAAVFSDVGLVPRGNEDAWTWSPLGDSAAMIAVADGWSGAEAAGLATRTVARNLRRLAEQRGKGAPNLQTWIHEAFGAAHGVVRKLSVKGGGTGADTTLAVAIHHKDSLVVGQVGDTRAWILRGGTLHPLGDHDARAALLGGRKKVDPQVSTWTCQSGDRLLMATRGLWVDVAEDRIAQVLKRELDPRAAVRRLVREAVDAGGRENVTAAVLDL